MTYDQYLQNLMGDLNPQGNMLSRGPVQVPDVSAIQQAVQNVRTASQYQPTSPAIAPSRELSDLNAIREAKRAELAQRNIANAGTDSNSRLAASVAFQNAGGSDYGGQSNLTDEEWAAVKDIRDAMGWNNPFDTANAKAFAAVAGGMLAPVPGVGAKGAATYTKDAQNFLKTWMETPREVQSLLSRYPAPTNQTESYGAGAWGGEGSGGGGFSYGDTSDSGYASDAGYSGGGGWSSSDYSGGWSGY